MDLAAAYEIARDIDLAAAQLRKIAPNSGSYVSESNYFNRSWQNEYWERIIRDCGRSKRTAYSASTTAWAAKSGAPTALRDLPNE
jgi:hypothetical protein